MTALELKLLDVVNELHQQLIEEKENKLTAHEDGDYVIIKHKDRTLYRAKPLTK